MSNIGKEETMTTLNLGMNSQRVLALFKASKGPLTIQHVQAALGIERVGVILNRLYRGRHLERKARGVYQLPTERKHNAHS
jgi:hypothetical protein